MAFAHGKVILFGEHAVVFGRTAIAAALDRGVTATARQGPAALTIRPWGVTLTSSEAPPLEHRRLRDAWDAVRATYEGRADELVIDADVAVHAAAGLGCSAALGVAIVGAIDEALGAVTTASERAGRAMAWERVFHGAPSGVDAAISASGGVIAFRRDAPIERLRPRREMSLVVAFGGEASSTKEMVASVARQRERSADRVEQTFDGIETLTRNARLAIEAADAVAVGQLFDLNQMLLASLALSTPRLEVLCRTAREAGATGAKLTGAGGGGCIVAAARDARSATTIVAALVALGADAFTTELKP